MDAFLKFNRGLLQMSPVVQGWLMLLVGANLIVPLFLLGTFEARVVVATMMASLMLMTAITARAGFTRLLGLGHILWVPLLVYLWGAWPDHPVDTTVGRWLRVVIAVDAASLVIDAIDVTKYLNGDRRELV